MYIIFLDIYGTLITTQSVQAGLEICPIALSNLRYMLRVNPKVKIVLTGEFKKGKSIEELRVFFEEQDIEHHRILDRVKPSRNDVKLAEIKNWIKYNKPIKYAIIDSDDSMGRLSKYYFKVNYEEGLMYTVGRKVVNYFKT